MTQPSIKTDRHSAGDILRASAKLTRMRTTVAGTGAGIRPLPWQAYRCARSFAICCADVPAAQAGRWRTDVEASAASGSNGEINKSINVMGYFVCRSGVACRKRPK